MLRSAVRINNEIFYTSERSFYYLLSSPSRAFASATVSGIGSLSAKRRTTCGASSPHVASRSVSVSTVRVEASAAIVPSAIGRSTGSARIRRRPEAAANRGRNEERQCGSNDSREASDRIRAVKILVRSKTSPELPFAPSSPNESTNRRNGLGPTGDRL